MAVGPKFGSAGRSLRFGVDKSAERLDLVNGFETELYFRALNDTRSEEVEKLMCYGIAPKETNPFSRTLTTVSHSENEDVITHESWTENDPNTDQTTQGGPLVAVDAMLKWRAEERWSVSGYGELPERVVGTPWAPGDVTSTALVINSATTAADHPTEALSITIPVGAYLENVSIQGENTNWRTFTLEFVKYTGQTDLDDPFADIVAAPTQVMNEEVDWDIPVPNNYWYRTSKTTTLNAEGFGTVEFSMELHEKHPNSIVTTSKPAP